MSDPAFVAAIRYIKRKMLLAVAQPPNKNTAVRASFFGRASYSVHTIGVGIQRIITSPDKLSTPLPRKNLLELMQRAPAIVGSQAALTGVQPKIDTKSMARNQHTMNTPTA